MPAGPVQTIDRHTSLKEAAGLFRDNCDYDLVESIEKAKLFIRACRTLGALRPSTAELGNERLSYTQSDITKQREQAEQWLKRAARGHAASIPLDLRGYRDP